MQRKPKGQYFRDSWDWLGSDACFAQIVAGITANTQAGVFIKNVATAGEFFDVAWIHATTDQPGTYQLIVDPNPVRGGLRSTPQTLYLNVIEGKPPLDGDRYASTDPTRTMIAIGENLIQEFNWPLIRLAPFLRIPPNWSIGIMVNAGANLTSLAMTVYGQFIAETDIHTGNAAPARK